MRKRKLLSTAELASLTGLSPERIRHLARTGYIQAQLTPGGHRRYDENAVARLMRLLSQDSRVAIYMPHRVTGYPNKGELIARVRELRHEPVTWIEELEQDCHKSLPARPGFRTIVRMAAGAKINGFVTLRPGMISRWDEAWVELLGELGLSYYDLSEHFEGVL